MDSTPGYPALKHICILGSTGSIGVSTLSVIESHPDRFTVASLAAGRNIDVWVTADVMQFFDGDHLLRTEQRSNTGEVRKKRASVIGGRARI